MFILKDNVNEMHYLQTVAVLGPYILYSRYSSGVFVHSNIAQFTLGWQSATIPPFSTRHMQENIVVFTMCVLKIIYFELN